jgi:hypothetical protein
VLEVQSVLNVKSLEGLKNKRDLIKMVHFSLNKHRVNEYRGVVKKRHRISPLMVREFKLTQGWRKDWPGAGWRWQCVELTLGKFRLRIEMQIEWVGWSRDY